MTLTVPLHSQSGFRFDGTPVTQLRIISSLGGTEILRKWPAHSLLIRSSVNILKGKIQAQCPRKNGRKIQGCLQNLFFIAYKHLFIVLSNFLTDKDVFRG
jgi:hypothetical protein